MTQIGGYVSKAERGQFKKYAADLQISESAVATLLILRELQLRRLSQLKESYSLGAPANDRARITAHQSNDGLKAAFEARSGEEDMLPDQAASLVFRAELTERWLRHAIDRKPLESY